MFLTNKKGWLWQEFELALLRAGSMAELMAAKYSASKAVRVAVMEQWTADGRYNWLNKKAELLSTREDEYQVFWSSDQSKWPKVGDLLRMGRREPHNRPYEVMKRLKDSNKQVWLSVRDVATGEPMELAKMEDFEFWPTVGGKVGILIREYLDWLADQRSVHARNEGALAQIERRLKAYGAENGHVGGDVVALLRYYDLVEVEQGMGVVALGDERVRCPLTVLYVPRKS